MIQHILSIRCLAPESVNTLSQSFVIKNDGILGLDACNCLQFTNSLNFVRLKHSLEVFELIRRLFQVLLNKIQILILEAHKFIIINILKL